MDIREIKNNLNRNAEEVCRKLLPAGKKESKRWIVGSVNGDKGRSLSVPLEGRHLGQWQDFSTGQGGDLIDLWKEVNGLSLQQTLSEVKKYLGVSEPEFIQNSVKNYKRPELPTNKPSNPVAQYLTKNRGLTVETLKKFGVESDGEFYYLPYYRDGELVSWKKISINRDEKGKKKMFCSPESEPILFGWQALDPDARLVFITEGELDAMTLHQFGFQALSIPFGAGSGDKMRWIESEYTNLERFEEIVLCFDNDQKGQEAVREYACRLGVHRTNNVKLPFKDANECLLQGFDNSRMHAALADYNEFALETLKSPMDFYESTLRRFYPSDKESGFPLNFGEGTEMKFRPSEITLWTGINGHGKSLVLGQVILDLITGGEKVFLGSMELKPEISLERMVRQATTMRQPSPDYLHQVFEWWSDSLYIFDVLGNSTPEKLLEAMAYARQKYGVTHFIIDSLMKCGIDSNDYNRQKSFVAQLCDFRSQYDCHIHLVAHVRKSDSESNLPDKMDVSGTSDIINQVDNQIAVWRNKAKEEESRKDQPDEKKMNAPDGLLVIQKHRNGEWEGKLPMWFDSESKQFLSRRNKPPHRYVDYKSPVRLVQ